MTSGRIMCIAIRHCVGHCMMIMRTGNPSNSHLNKCPLINWHPPLDLLETL